MMVLILILGQILLIIAGLWVVCSVIDKVIDRYNLRLSFRKKRKSYTKPESRKPYREPVRIPHELLIKVGGDAATAERLINQLQMKHPGKSSRWYAEKAIFDLERDKGRY
jgi:hypothetical protein